jgi:hypothetical protein
MIGENVSYIWRTFVGFKLILIYVIITDWTTRESGFNFQQEQRFQFSLKHPYWLWGSYRFISNGYWGH